MEIKVGTRIKALDFPGREDCYMVGEVIEIEGDYIRCRGELTVWSGSPKTASDFTTVREGCNFLDKHYPGRITVMA